MPLASHVSCRLRPFPYYSRPNKKVIVLIKQSSHTPRYVSPISLPPFFFLSSHPQYLSILYTVHQVSALFSSLKRSSFQLKNFPFVFYKVQNSISSKKVSYARIGRMETVLTTVIVTMPGTTLSGMFSFLHFLFFPFPPFSPLRPTLHPNTNTTTPC